MPSEVGCLQAEAFGQGSQHLRASGAVGRHVARAPPQLDLQPEPLGPQLFDMTQDLIEPACSSEPEGRRTPLLEEGAPDLWLVPMVLREVSQPASRSDQQVVEHRERRPRLDHVTGVHRVLCGRPMMKPTSCRVGGDPLPNLLRQSEDRSAPLPGGGKDALRVGNRFTTGRGHSLSVLLRRQTGVCQG